MVGSDSPKELSSVLHELVQQREEFMSIVSHELKTPTTSLKAYAHLLEKRLIKEGSKESITFINKMNRQIDKLTYLIEDLLEVSRLEKGKLQYHVSLFDFEPLVKEIVEDMQLTTHHKITKKGSIRQKIFGDSERIGQVITNLLSNAIKFSPKSSEIVVTVAEDKKQVKLSVQDFGLGLGKAELPHIFERFFRASNIKHATYPGLGLGLYISSEIIKKHKGKIWVESEKGKGSTFSFSIPVNNYLS